MAQRRRPTEPAARARSARPAAVPERLTTLVPACGSNDPNAAVAAGVLCTAAMTACPTPGDVLFWVFTAPRAADGSAAGRWVAAGSLCRGAASAGAPAAATPAPVVTVEDLRRLGLPAPAVVVQPPGGRTVVGVPTNVYVQAGPVVRDTTLLGLPVRVRAEPVRFRWDFGDGTTPTTTADPGAPYPDLRVTHTYTGPGVVAVRLTTAYAGEFSVAGGPWLPVLGEAEVAGPPSRLEVLAGGNALVADLVR